jgi:hypothetical protein
MAVQTETVFVQFAYTIHLRLRLRFASAICLRLSARLPLPIIIADETGSTKEYGIGLNLPLRPSSVSGYSNAEYLFRVMADVKAPIASALSRASWMV